MAFDPNKKGGTTYDVIPEDVYGMRLARIIELGQQEDKYGVKEKVVFSFTVPDVTIDINGEPKQRMITTFPMTLTANEDSTLMKYMKALNPEPKGWADVFLKPCMGQVDHTTKGDKVYAQIKNVTKLMKGLVVAMPDCECYIFDFQNPDKDVWDKLPKYYQDMILSAKNFKGSAVERMIKGVETSNEVEQDEEAPVEDAPF